MEATVISVQPNVTKQGRSGSYQVHIFTYQGDPYKGQPKPPTERMVFTNNRDFPELPGKVLALQPGQRVNLTFDNSGQYPNLTDVFVIQGGQSPPQQAPPQQYQQQQTPPAGQFMPGPAPEEKKKDYTAEREAKDAEKQVLIVRQVALKAGVEIVVAMLAREKQYKQKMELDVLATDAIHLADLFERYVFNVQDFDPQSGPPLIGNELPVPPYNDDEIPF